MKPKIVVPYDFSDMAEQALTWAADFQRTTNAPALHIVHAISSRPVGATDVPVERLLPDEAEIAELERDMLDRARRAEASATAAVWIRASKVGDIILDAAASEKAELIVMGSHGRTGVKRLILGSVAEHVLRHARCPVVTIHGPIGHAK
jgi:nucleotide-binding universal stress UspA family protein